MKRLGRPSARRWRRLFVDEGGAAATEFAILGPLFLLTMMAVFDVSWMFSRNMALDSATRSIARDIRTGQIYVADNPESEFRRRLCDEMILVNCGEVVVDIQDAGADFRDMTEPADFTSESFSTYLDPSALVASSQMGIVNFTAGQPESVMMVRTGVAHEFMTPLLHELWTDGDGVVEFTVTEIFRNEPFPS
jgi:Flp pilus assembly protein TadG